MLRYSSSFLDRLEEVGIVSRGERRSPMGLSGPIARASGIGRDMRKLFPYAAYESVEIRASRSKRKATAMRGCGCCSTRPSNRPP